jgi:regulatory protein
VGKYATTRAKLCAYLSRKLRERGWSEETEPDLDALANRFTELGYVDDAAYALAKARSLGARGYGKRRIAQKLSIDGVDEEDGTAARALAHSASLEAALIFARRRRIGPFAPSSPDRSQREKWIAAMVRAGHDYGLSRAISMMNPGANFDAEALGDVLSRPEINLD